MRSLRFRLMHREASQRLQDAETLSEAWNYQEHSDSAYLLRLLGFELLLKIVFEVMTRTVAPTHHKYQVIFSGLPNDVQVSLLARAGERVGPSALAKYPLGVFTDWATNFVGLRYPWEKYSALSEEQYVAIGVEWVAGGSQLEDATFRYHPEELVGMLAALQTLVDELIQDSANGE